MNIDDDMRSIVSVEAGSGLVLKLVWSDGMTANVDAGTIIDNNAIGALRNPQLFTQVAIGDWGHSLLWPGEIEIGADLLWQESLSATGRSDTRQFLEWRMRHGLSLSKAAEALGLSRRAVAYYSNGEKKVPKPILLACRGWEVEHARAA